MIGISLVTLAPGRMGGSESYARALTEALHRVGEFEYFVAAPSDALDAAGGLRAVPAGRSGRSRRLEIMARAAGARSALIGATLVHYPLTVPLPDVRAPRVITLHDVLHRDRPELVSRSTRVFRAAAYDRAARMSDRVIVPSCFVRERAEAAIRLDPESVRVVPHGVDHSMFHPGPETREPFLLYPARSWPHKNHARLFEAFALVRRERPELELVLTGEGHDAYSLPAGVRSAGLVPGHELARLYRTAGAMVFPSLYEGFGAPILEAMASGCAVAASDAAAIPEVAGGAAVLFDPSSAEAIAEGISQALADQTTRVADGLTHARSYTWDAAASVHESVYSELVS